MQTECLLRHDVVHEWLYVIHLNNLNRCYHDGTDIQQTDAGVSNFVSKLNHFDIMFKLPSMIM